jgi:hypothetical protein
MELKYSDDKKIFTVHRKGIPYLSSCMLDSLGVPPENIMYDNFGS